MSANDLTPLEQKPEDLEESPSSPVSEQLPGLFSRFKQYGWPILCLFQLGLIVGAFRVGNRLATTGEPETPATDFTQPAQSGPDVREPRPVPSHGFRSAVDLEEIDLLLRAGRYQPALMLTRVALAESSGSLRDALQYRVGVCLESSGQWQDALSAYRAFASNTLNPQQAAVASVGQARVYLHLDQRQEAKEILCDLLLRSAAEPLSGQPFLADVRYLLALAQTSDALPLRRLDPYHDLPLAPGIAGWSVEHLLTEMTGQTAPDKQARPDEDTVKVQRIGSDPEAYRVQATSRAGTLAALLDRLAEEAKLQIEWSPRARRQVEERTRVVEFDDLPLATVLWALTEPLQLVWQIQTGKLLIASQAEVPGKELGEYRLAHARRGLRESIVVSPDHLLTAAAYLEMGNLEFATGRWSEANAWYRRLIGERSQSPLMVLALYNLALLQQQQGDGKTARQTFYRVVDRSPGHELAPVAYWRIGRLHLEEGEVEQGLWPLRRSLALANDAPIRAAATISLACAHLLSKDPRAANGVLVENREQIGQYPFRPVAAFLDSLARYRLSVNPRDKQREINDLLTTVLVLKDDYLLGSAGRLLMGQAYQELGMVQQMLELYEQALAKVSDPVAARMLHELAELDVAARRFEAAVKRYTQLLERGTGPGKQRARYRLAEMALQMKKPQECLDWCGKILAEPEGQDPSAILRLMAEAYHQAGKPQLAIRCLSGELPEGFPPSVPKP